MPAPRASIAVKISGIIRDSSWSAAATPGARFLAKTRPHLSEHFRETSGFPRNVACLNTPSTKRFRLSEVVPTPRNQSLVPASFRTLLIGLRGLRGTMPALWVVGAARWRRPFSTGIDIELTFPEKEFEDLREARVSKSIAR